MSDITYADVARFYADKDDTDEIATGKYEKVASWVWKMDHDDVQQGVFLDHPNAKYEMLDNKAFALFVASSKGKKDGTEWQTVSFYNKHKRKNDPVFHNWFTNRCKPKDRKYRPGQKWHLFEYILFQEIVSEYQLSSEVKNDLGDLNNEPFKYYNNNNTSYIDLMVWMAKNAGFNEKLEKKLADEKENKMTGADIRKCVSWNEISEKINEWKHNNPI